MNEPYNVPYKEIIHFLLIMIRISSFILIAPFWSHQSINTRIKIGLSCIIAFVIGPVVPSVPVMADNFLSLILLVSKQICIGVILGFIARLFLDGVRFGAAFLDLQMGFSFGKMVDPAFGVQSSVMEMFYGLIAIMILICTNGHHLLLKSIIGTFSIIPLDSSVNISENLLNNILIMISQIFIYCLQIAGPIVIILFLLDSCMGIMAKMMPQMNIFILDAPLKLTIGIICVIVCLPFFPDIVSYMLNNTLEQILFVAKSL